MDRLKAMATFVRIVDTGSLTAAAEALGKSPASVVRSLAALEKQLGVRLLNRNSRRQALTDEGADYLAWCRRILAEFEELEHGFEARRSTPSGLLRLTAPVEFGRQHVLPLVNRFMAAHPAMRVELVLLDRPLDLLEEGLDLAIRIGRLPDSSLVAVPLGRTRQVVCASPRLLAETAPIERPQDLQGLPGIVFTPQGRAWRFASRGAALEMEITARLSTNQIQAALGACLDGLGVAQLLHYQVARELADGRLVRLLRAYEAPALPIQLVYPHARLLSSRVRRFMDWVTAELGASIPDPG